MTSRSFIGALAGARPRRDVRGRDRRMGLPHFLEGGRTAVLTEGPKAGYLLDPTREFVIAGGARVPAGSALVRIGEHAWEILRRW